MIIKLRSPGSNNRTKISIEAPKDVAEDAIRIFEEPDTETSIKEELLKRVFQTTKELGDICCILQKCTLLNIFYTTQIKDKDLIAISRRIYTLNSIQYHDMGLVEYLLFHEDDPQKYRALVNLIAYSSGDDAVGNCYSFASKFCSWHAPHRFPIVDSYAKGLLYRITEDRDKEYMKQILAQMPGNTKKQQQSFLYSLGLNDYRIYCQLYDGFKQDDEFCLADMSYKKIDEYIWQYATSLFNESSDYCVLNQIMTPDDEIAIDKKCEKEIAKPKKRRTDEQIKKQVRKEYINSKFVYAFKIEPNYKNAEVILQDSKKALAVIF